MISKNIRERLARRGIFIPRFAPGGMLQALLRTAQLARRLKPAAGQKSIDFEEEQHPRANDGKFTSKAGGEVSSRDLKHGDVFRVPESHTTGEYQAKLESHGDYVAFPRLDGIGFQPKIRKSQFPQFLDDLRGVVTGTPDSKSDDVNAVLRGQAEFLGRGNDGLAFATGKNVVKVASDVPFHWNNGLRDRGEGSDRMRTSVRINEELRKSGVGSLLPQKLVDHDGRAFVVMPKLDTAAKLTQDQFDGVVESVKKMHDLSYTVGDDIQVGVGEDGKAYIFDVGAARGKADRFDKDTDEDRLRRLATDNGLEFTAINPEVAHYEAIEDAMKFLERMEKLEQKGKPIDPKPIQRRLETLRALRAKIDDDTARFTGHEDTVDNLLSLQSRVAGPRPKGSRKPLALKPGRIGVQLGDIPYSAALSRHLRALRDGSLALKWVTIGGHAEGDKKHADGFAVQIDERGNIVRANGPKSLVGTNISGAKKHLAGNRPKKTRHITTMNDRDFMVHHIQKVVRKGIEKAAGDSKRIQKWKQAGDAAVATLKKAKNFSFRDASSLSPELQKVAGVAHSRYKALLQQAQKNGVKLKPDQLAHVAKTSWPSNDAKGLRKARYKGEQQHLMSPESAMNPDAYSGFEDAFASLPPKTQAFLQKSVQVHGLAAGNADENLLNLLRKGIDPNREFHSGPPRGGMNGVDTSRTVAPYILLSNPGQSLSDTGVKTVFLTGPAEANADSLRQEFPDVSFITAKELPAWAAKARGAKLARKPAKGQGGFNFDETEHPRDDDGKFAPKEGGETARHAEKPATPKEPAEKPGQIARKRNAFHLEKPIVGPSGGELHSYEWKYYIDSDVDEEGEEVARRVSDWDESQTNEHTGREVVHHFHVKTPDGVSHTVSLETALHLMGYTAKGPLSSGVNAVKSIASAVKSRGLAQIKLQQQEEMVKTLEASWKSATAAVNATPIPPIEETTDWRGNRAWKVGDSFAYGVIERNGSNGQPPRSETEAKGEALSDWKRNRLKEHMAPVMKEATALFGFTPGNGYSDYWQESLNREISKTKSRIADLDVKLKDLAEAGGGNPADRHRDAARTLHGIADRLRGASRTNDPRHGVDAIVRKLPYEQQESASKESREMLHKLFLAMHQNVLGEDTSKTPQPDAKPARAVYGRFLKEQPAHADAAMSRWYLKHKAEIDDATETAQKWLEKYAPAG